MKGKRLLYTASWRILLIVIIGLMLTMAACSSGAAPASSSSPSASASPSSAENTKVYEWKLQAFATANEAKYTCLLDLSKNVETASNGRFKIKVYPTGEIAAGAAVWDAVKDNVVQMGTATQNWWGGKDVAWLALATGPFTLPGINMPAAFYYEGGGIEIGNKLAQKFGMLYRPASWMGSEAGILTTFPATKLDDLKGKTLRLGPGIPTDVIVEAAGVSAVSLSGPETYEALQRKVVDGVEWATLDACVSAKFYEVCTHLIGPAVWQPGTMEHFLINEKAYNELPEDLKQILELGIRVNCDQSTYAAYMQGIEAYETMTKEGMVITKFSAGDMRKFEVAAEKVFADYNAKYPEFKEIYDAKMAFQARYEPVEEYLTIPEF